MQTKEITVGVMGATYILTVDDTDPDQITVESVIDLNETEYDPEDWVDGLDDDDWKAIKDACVDGP